jgi:hypothetical protein
MVRKRGNVTGPFLGTRIARDKTVRTHRIQHASSCASIKSGNRGVCHTNADLQRHDKKDYFPDDRAYLVTNSPSTR